jgi:5-methylthioadenosine/S-adenosylhomocysteine deaminase
VNENDCEILASKGVAAVDCPTSQARLGLGNTPVGSLRAAGVAVALGGGEPTAGGRLGMLGEVRRSALRQSGAAAAGSTSPEQMALAMATRDAARALGFGTSGLVAPGYTADLILVDRDNERLLGGERLADLVVYSAQEGDISDVMAGGKWLMRDRRLLTLDEAAIRYEAERRGRRLTGDQKNTAGL